MSSSFETQDLPSEIKSVKRSLLDPASPGEKVTFSDNEDEEEACASATKKSKSEPPPRRIAIASAKNDVKVIWDAVDAHGHVHVYPLSLSIADRSTPEITIHWITDLDGVNYDIGSINAKQKVDPEKGLDLGFSEIVGLASVAADIVEVLVEDPKAFVVIADTWGKDYSPFLAALVQRLYTVQDRSAKSITSGMRKPEAQKLKDAIKAIGRTKTGPEMREALKQFYIDNF